MEKNIIIRNDSKILSKKFIDSVTLRANEIKYKITDIGYNMGDAIIYYDSSIESINNIEQIFITRDIMNNENIVTFRYKVYDMADQYKDDYDYIVKYYVDNNVAVLSILNRKPDTIMNDYYILVDDSREGDLYYYLASYNGKIVSYTGYDQSLIKKYDTLSKARLEKNEIKHKLGIDLKIFEFSFHEVK